ncbi:hypothetical protein GXP71_06890 [Cellulomonas sp. H30R-01]|uniref:hypothetical protein n=1 Tax=Cellulomonas sp. H30R-01 TaxID=2704467 RepID=UPI00138D8B39|nr:hypothetical protein [Cellulomonas sp. H30R-01]QHT55832.1 hypothetical protein GXP71_06890 [Cellulomonas sp. H30R-01]
MSGAKKSTWIGGTVFIGLVMAVAAWFLAISPTLAAAAELRTEAQQTREQNDLLDLRVKKLAADFAKLPEYRAQLDALRTQIPVEANLAAYIRELDAIAVAHSVTLVGVSPSTAQAVVVAPPAAAPAAETPAGEVPAEGSTEATGATDGTGATAAPEQAAGAPAGFAAIPFSITALGTYDNVIAFLSDIQNATPRLFLVTGLVGTAQDQADAGAGRPATAPGDLELIISGQTYVLPDALAVPPTEEAAPPALPGAVPGKNPLLPIPGQ